MDLICGMRDVEHPTADILWKYSDQLPRMTGPGRTSPGVWSTSQGWRSRSPASVPASPATAPPASSTDAAGTCHSVTSHVSYLTVSRVTSHVSRLTVSRVTSHATFQLYILVCRFNCPTGPNIDSVCSSDGTWAPYPTCQGDRRELRDGCDGCPGPQGGLRNRTAEAILNQNTVSDRRVPKVRNLSEHYK